MPTQLKRDSMLGKLATGTLAAFGMLALFTLLLTTHDSASADLGSAETYGVLAGTAVDLTGASVVDEDLGISPGAAYTGGGTITVNGAENLGNLAAASAQADLATNYATFAALPCDTDLTGQNLGTVSPLTPAAYCFTTTAQLTGALVLDATSNPAGQFIFQIGTALTIDALAIATVTGGGSVCNVFWQVGTTATLGADSVLAGSILADDSITLGNNASPNRALAINGAVSLDANTITGCPVAVVTDTPTPTPVPPTDTPTPTPVPPTDTPTPTPVPPTDTPTPTPVPPTDTPTPTPVPPTDTPTPTPVPPTDTPTPTPVPPTDTPTPTPVPPTDTPTPTPVPPTDTPTPTPVPPTDTPTPTPTPTATPTATPTPAPPTDTPTPTPTVTPTDTPTPAPTDTPTPTPTVTATAVPTDTAVPTFTPTATPTSAPTAPPVATDTPEPTAEPTDAPTPEPTDAPTAPPTSAPSPTPTATPQPTPTATATPAPTTAPTPTPLLVSGDAVTVEGTVFGQSVAPVNHVNDDGTQSGDFDLNIGPLSITSDGATTDCDNSPGEQTCTSSLVDFTLSLDGIDIITADSLTAQSNSTDGTSNDDGTGFSGLCILQSLGNECTQVPDAGPQSISIEADQSVGDYDVEIPGVALGMITVQAETHTTSKNGVPGSGLTVTMLRVALITPDGPINLDLVQAHSFAASADGTTPSPVLSPPAAPTVAALPQTGGPAGGSGSIPGWYLALAGLVIFLGTAGATTLATRRRNSNISDR